MTPRPRSLARRRSRFADLGKRVLLVSTDPASNLDEMLGVKLGNEPESVLFRS